MTVKPNIDRYKQQYQALFEKCRRMETENLKLKNENALLLKKNHELRKSIKEWQDTDIVAKKVQELLKEYRELKVEYEEVKACYDEQRYTQDILIETIKRMRGVGDEHVRQAIEAIRQNYKNSLTGS